MANTIPTISVIIPSYNHENFIEKAVRSVYGQTFRDIELIIVDDGSTDNSRRIIKKVLNDAKDIKTTYIEQDNAGAHAAIMRGVQESKGKFLGILNSDDFYFPNRFERLLPFIEILEDGIVFSKVKIVDESDNEIPKDSDWSIWYNQALKSVDENPTIGYALLVQNFSVSSGNFLFSKSLYNKLCGFSEHKFVHDWDFLIRAVYYVEPVFVPEVLMGYRAHSSNSAKSVRDLLMNESREALERYNALCEKNSPPSKLAPSRVNWPTFFSLFCNSRSTMYGRNLLKAIFDTYSSSLSGSEWFELVCKSIEGRTLEFSGLPLPGFPERDVQINTTGAAGRETLYEAYLFYEDCLKVFRNSSAFAREDRKLLDFGVGWGRILRFFMKDFLPENLFGVDINDELLNICKSTFTWGTFIKSTAFPPLDIPDKSVDFIVGYSVFSHLSEEACLSWIKEFSRILRPGGIVSLTTRGRWFLDYCKSLNDTNVEGYGKALSNLFDDFDQAKQRYDSGEFLHSNIEGVSGGGPLNATFYGESFIPQAYARKVYSDYFKVLNFEFTQGRSEHPIMFFQK